MNKISLANLPTKIEKLERLSKKSGVNFFIKRDDQTGTEFSGNKIRKLEFSVKEALDRGCDMLITTGGIQSNHCRATVSIAARLGLKVAVLLRVPKKDQQTTGSHRIGKDEAFNFVFGERGDLTLPEVEGNYFLDRLMGADVQFCSPEEYSAHRNDIMQLMSDRYAQKGFKPYIIPEGASNGVGALGYYYAMKEIVRQEKELGVVFDTVVVACGSGGTSSGLNLANKIGKLGKRVIGICVCDDNDYFQNRIAEISNEALDYLVAEGEISESMKPELTFTPNEIEMNDQYVGRGYALSRDEELEFIKEIATLEGVIFDPVYTGKGIYGLYNELKASGTLHDAKNVLFIHTGGLYGLFPSSRLFRW